LILLFSTANTYLSFRNTGVHKFTGWMLISPMIHIQGRKI
jgi:hypothetical protein